MLTTFNPSNKFDIKPKGKPVGIYATAFCPQLWKDIRVKVLDIMPAFQRRNDRRPYKEAEVMPLRVDLYGYFYFAVPVDRLSHLTIFFETEENLS